MLDVVEFEGEMPGPRLTVLGAVHGNERCGTEAIHRVTASLRSGDLALTSGTLVMVPVTNPRANAENLRFIDIWYGLPKGKQACTRITRATAATRT